MQLELPSRSSFEIFTYNTNPKNISKKHFTLYLIKFSFKKHVFLCKYSVPWERERSENNFPVLCYSRYADERKIDSSLCSYCTQAYVTIHFPTFPSNFRAGSGRMCSDCGRLSDNSCPVKFSIITGRVSPARLPLKTYRSDITFYLEKNSGLPGCYAISCSRNRSNLPVSVILCR